MTVSPPPPEIGSNNLWYLLNDSPSAIVFVHGILSDSRSCWLSTHGGQTTYWPQLVSADPRLQHPAVFLGGFYTAVDAGAYNINDCAKELLNGLMVPDVHLHRTPLEKERIVFICHSTGGIVARYMLTRYADKFREKEVGLVLIASPSYGSKLADTLGGLANFYNNQLGIHLKWGNDVLKNLDDEFKELLDRKTIPRLTGIEACENHFIFHRRFLPDKQFVVERESAGRYFTVRMLPNTDHFSTVKPSGFDHPAHKLLVEFWLRRYGPPFTRDLRDLLDASKEDMRLRNMPYFTPALLLALLHENGFASSVLNSVRPASAKELRARFRHYLDVELPAIGPGVFHDFDWFDRDDVRRAQQFASEEQVSSISERMLLKAVLMSTDSKSVAQVKQFFAADFEKISAEIEHRRLGAAQTPGIY
jgi:pimeloyl-ACP methyl ester carboxylesterase